MKLFAQITKVDQANRLVYGVAAVEQLDRSGEIMDYATSKAHFESWSKEQFDASGGKSYGNVRAMHGKVAAGVVPQPLAFNESGKQVECCAKVVDDSEWAKVESGTYTGFSIGGSYEKKWEDPAMKKGDGTAAMRYTAKPSEISLVDRPCMPGANFFEIKKADGSTDRVPFKAKEEGEEDDDKETVEETPEEKKKREEAEAAEAAKSDTPTEYTIEGTAEEVDAFAKFMADNKLSVGAAHITLVKALEQSTQTEEQRVDAAFEVLRALKKADDAAYADRLHKFAKEMGAACAEKADAPTELAKIDTAALAKMVADEVAKVTKTHEETVTKMSEKIKKLEDEPRAPKAILRVVSKAEDTNELSKPVPQVAPVLKMDGEVNEVATSIKAIHAGRT